MRNILVACAEVILLLAISGSAIYLALVDTSEPWIPVYVSCNDERYRKPVAPLEDQLVPINWLYFFVLVILPCVILAVQLIINTVFSVADPRKKCTHNWANALCMACRLLSCYYAGIFLLLILCKLSQVIGGKPAPYFLTLCAPGCSNVTGTHRDPVTKRMFITSDACRETIGDGFRTDTFSSFPSLHAALAFYSATFITAHYCLPRTAVSTPLLQPFFATVVITLAAVASLSRVTEYSNHVEDVLCGAVLGCASSLVQVFIVGTETPKRPGKKRRQDEDEND